MKFKRVGPPSQDQIMSAIAEDSAKLLFSLQI